jgi:hypothetical protein
MLKKIIPLIMVMVLMGTSVFAAGCSSRKGEGFAIYLTEDDVLPARMRALSHINLAAEPFIALKDVISYNQQTHELKLTPETFKKVIELEVPVQGKSFLVCVDRSIIYFGAFWTPVSSISFDGVTIWKPYASDIKEIVTLELGYPAESFYGGIDPRNDEKILSSLRKAGKLIDRLNAEDIKELPASMKGYELYSWTEGNDWRFTLITGTNRNKTVEEIISEDNYISEMGWTKITVAGIDAIEIVLDKLPDNESVSWSDGGRTGLSTSPTKLMLPDEIIVNRIKEFAREHNIDLDAVR